MKQEQWRRAEELFHSALELAPEARGAFLDKACGEDTELRHQIELLVSKDEHGGSLLEKPVLADVTVMPVARGSGGAAIRFLPHPIDPRCGRDG
jgi:serine/threonine-protein kinase